MPLRRTAPTGLARLTGTAALLIAALLAGCASLTPRDITLSRADLQTLVERQFPREQRVMEVVDVSLARPELRLVPERNRIATALDLSAAERITGRSLRGHLAIEHSLRFESSDATVRLAQVKVNELKLDAGGGPLAGQSARLGALLVERLLDDFVIYRVADDKREALRRAGVQAATVEVTSRGVELRFSEAK
jgi:hypothetical protein